MPGDRSRSFATPTASVHARLRDAASLVEIVGCLEPAFHFIVDVVERRDRDAVGDAVALGQAAGVDEASRWLRFGQGEAEVDAGAGRGFDLREHVAPIERDDRLAW